MQNLVRCIFIGILALATIVLNAQEEWARVSIVCPCTLESEDGTTATVQFGLKNLENHRIENIWATIAATGSFDDEEFSEEQSMFLGTGSLNFTLSELEEVETGTYEIELGKLPAGDVYLELLVHEGKKLTFASLLDSVWFEEETEMPFTSLSKGDMDYLKDTDGDGVADLNEEFMNTDPNDPEDFPDKPEIDVLVVYETGIQDKLPGDDPSMQISHIFAVTNFLYERSGSPLRFRVVDTLDETDVPEIEDGNFFMPQELRDQYQEEYGADLIVVLHPGDSGLCGIAEDIGGWRGRGFIHPMNRAILTHVFMNPAICPINVTAHEIGHLMGLGHSYVQGSVGTFYWSRGHGEHHEFGTVMSYADFAYNGIDIDKFSNPDEDCNGKPCGVSHELSNHERSSDSILSVNITKYQIAAAGTPPSDLDVDGDGYAADVDQFPVDATEWVDTDGDGYGDNSDLFPNLATEWADADGDGIGDNSDPDIDDDGVLNQLDADPFDPDVSSVQILNIVSGQQADGLGTEVLRTGDWDNDGLDDLAISSPMTKNEDGETIGAVYLLSMTQLIPDPLAAEQSGSQRDINQLVDDEHAWAIHGMEGTGETGRYMAYLSVTEDAGTSESLVISSEQSVYMIQLNDATLRSFDGLDGTADRRLNLEFCETSPGCWLGGENDFVVKGVAAMNDRDDDGTSDFAVLVSRPDEDEVSLYLLTTASLQLFDQQTGDDQSALDAIVEDFTTAFRLHTDSSLDNLSLANVGDVTGFSGHELGVAIGGEGGPISIGPGPGFPNNPGGQDQGTVYILDTELAFLIDSNDGTSDRQVHMDEFLGAELNSYKITMPDFSAFGRGVDSLADINGDDRPEVMMWSGEYEPHALLTTQGLKDMDGRGGAIDGEIELQATSYEYSGVWYFYDIQTKNESSQSVLNPTTDDQSSYILGPFGRSVLLIELDDPDMLDNPDVDRRNGQIRVPTLLGRSGVTQLRAPQGLRPGTVYGGMSPLGDVDGDGVLDFMFTAQTQGADRQLTSTVQVMFSASLSTIDKADGEEDSVVRLHNNLDDTDGDGIVNLHDMDDDNDGAPDSYDRYPLLSNAIYDADGDGTANVIDLFPNDPREHSDMDGDGVPDGFDFDIDGDGIDNFQDLYPLDTDNDGLNNYDDLDDDNDGIEDQLDAFPLDPDEQLDTDGDGFGDNADLFVDDANEWSDFDLDGIGDNGDLDDDNDGYEDDVDHFPFDPDEWLDSDGDGVGDNADLFPNNPFDWEDSDNDGLGDNLGNARIAMHRIDSESTTFNPFRGVSEVSTHNLGDFDLTGGTKLLIQGGNPNDPRSAVHLLSSTDLSQLDALDEQMNQSIQVREIASGAHSWELRGARSSDLLYHNYGVVTDIDGDSIGDLVIGGPFDGFGAGAIYIVHGSQLATADSIDGWVDGKINHTQCTFVGTCVAVSNSTDSFFGNSMTSLNGLFGDDTTAVAVTNYYASERPENEDSPDTPIVHLLSSTALSKEVEELQDGDLELDKLQEREDTLKIYPESDGRWASPIGNTVYQVADYDNDGAEDLIVELASAQSMYLLSSSDIVQADSDDGVQDGQIDISNIQSKPNSYRLNDFTTTLSSYRTTKWGSSTDAAQYIPLQEADEHYLLDTSELATHVSEDNAAEGIITSIDRTDTNAWLIQDVGSLQVCNDGMDHPDTNVVGLSNSFNDPGFYLFTLSQMRDWAEESDASSNVVDVPEAFESGTSGFWSITLGSLANDLFGLQISCVGDWDSDGKEDLAVSIMQASYFSERAKATILLVMSGDLSTLDGLDDTVDNEIDLSLLWRKASDD